MRCPYCHENASVMDTREYVQGMVRRRKCRACGRLFYSVEKVVDYEEGLRIIYEAQNEHYHRKVKKNKDKAVGAGG